MKARTVPTQREKRTWCCERDISVGKIQYISRKGVQKQDEMENDRKVCESG
jgi:hypothetical protein